MMISADTRISYTVVRHSGHAWYHGAIRRRADDGVIWECTHDHDLVWPAQQCATSEMEARASQDAPAVEGQ